MSYLAEPKDPIRDVMRAMTGAEPPEFARGYALDSLTESQWEVLQDWCVDSVRPSWLTGIGLAEAVASQVAEAISNGNIPPAPKDGRRA